MSAADRIKNIRNLRNMTTYDLSEITKIPQSTISKIENDKRKIDSDSIIAIAEALDVSIDYLLKGCSHENNNYFIKDDFKDLIEAYKNCPDMQPAVNKLLGLDRKEIITN